MNIRHVTGGRRAAVAGLVVLALLVAACSAGSDRDSDQEGASTRRTSITSRIGSSSSLGATEASTLGAASHGAAGASSAEASTAHGVTASVTDESEPDSGGHGSGPAHWEYTGTVGQLHWSELTTDYTACVDGSKQSPINITQTVATPLKDLELNYAPGPITVVNNGHTIQANLTNGGGAMILDGLSYELLQFHFHRPSEHLVGGVFYSMEMHLVHANDNGELAVVGVFFDEGSRSGALESIWSQLPRTDGDEVHLDRFDVRALLPGDPITYRYLGSLTTPPCSEIVRWNLFKAPIEVSDDQVAAFRSLFEYNARYAQPRNGRYLLEDSGIDG